MAKTCTDTTLLTNSGTSQVQRPLDALITDRPLVDERTDADLILLTKRYAAYLNYYDLTNAIVGDWQGLMSNDVAVVIATIADWRTQDYASYIQSTIDDALNATTDLEAQEYFKVLFDFVFSLAVGLDNAYRQLPAKLDYTTFLSVSIASNLAAALSTLVYYYNQFKTNPLVLIDEALTFTDGLTPVDPLILSQNFNIASLSDPPFTSTAPATVYDITLTGTTALADIKHILTHNLFIGAYQAFIDGVTTIVSRTPAYLQDVLKDYPKHSPHYALYLAFLRLFSHAQKHLNKYTKRHLDFYYKDVLQLANSPAEADYVHLIFTLQKNINQHLLTQGTQFKAGKDAKGNNLFYALTDDIVLQTASVSALKSIYLDEYAGSPVTLYASPIANSQDGQGGKLLSADGSWPAFGNPENKILPANIGFALASNVLYLNEGTREIDITFNYAANSALTSAMLTGTSALPAFTIQLTGKKAWYTVPLYTIAVNSTSSFTLTITLAGDAPAIVPYSAKIHGGTFPQELPMAQIMLTGGFASYTTIAQLGITSIGITATVQDVKNLSLQNDDGKINTAKPFKLFGDFPEAGTAFIVGSKEIFQKQLSALSLEIEWSQAPISGTNVDSYALVKGDWQELGVIGLSTDNTIDTSEIVQSPADFTANDDYSVTEIDGFIKVELQGSAYNLSTYLSSMTPPSVTVNYATGSTTQVSSYTVSKPDVATPPHPIAKTLSVNYTGADTINLNTNTAAQYNARTNYFYHVEPFGFREIHPNIIAKDPLTLLPTFNLTPVVSGNDGGELWVGLSNALPDETFSVLFQVSDGSANPLQPATAVTWYYLSANNWLQFDDTSVVDYTNNLTTSGLVVLLVPDTATLTNTRADTGLLWIKAVVVHETDAICNLIVVDVNAAKAQFVQDIPDGIEFTQTLPPNTISKPAVADAALKQTQQPYNSFDGRVAETDSQFYVRVSERLRHKQRAITTWDYERIVLQQYPEIFKVKCLNHTGMIIDTITNQPKYSETLAGHVMVITIPDLTNINTVNPLRPYTSIGVLTKIQAYLATLTSPFVQLDVTNPQFEEVQFKFHVVFSSLADPSFYVTQLNNDIEQFLTPWAFGNPQAIEFGNTVEKSVVLNFVEERTYVDHVTCFKMSHIIRDGDTVISIQKDIEEAVPSTARSIIVSYYNEKTKVKHKITPGDKCDCNG